MGRKDKKPVPISEAPPPATSMSDVEDSDTDSDHTSDYSSSDEEQNSPSTPASKTPSSSTVPAPKQPSTTVVSAAAADDDDEEDSDDDSDDDSPPPKLKPFPPTSSTVKQPRSSLSKSTTYTVAATPTPTPAAATTTTVTVAALPSSKRPASESDNNNKGSEKRAKKDKSVAAEPGSRSSEAATPSKPLFQRLWSDEDEIVILKGLIEYREKKKVDPMTQVDDFLDFIKKSLHVADANRSQIISKVRRLKKRYSTGKQKKITNPHELNAFELMKQIWGGSEFDDENGDDTKKVDAMDSVVKEVKVKAKAKAKVKTNGEVNEEKKGGLWSIERCENVGVGGGGGGKVGVEVGEVAELDFGFSRANWAMVKEAMVKMGDGEKGELKKMVDEAKEAFLKADLLRLEADSLRQKVLEVATKKVLEGMRVEE